MPRMYQNERERSISLRKSKWEEEAPFKYGAASGYFQVAVIQEGVCWLDLKLYKL